MPSFLHDAALIILAFFCAQTSGSVSWDTGHFVVNQSDSFSITCTATDIDTSEIVRVQLLTSSGRYMAISDNQHVKQPFSSLSRYFVTYRYEGDIGYTTISYRGIRGEDSGLLNCYVLSSPESVAQLDIIVHVPVESVRIQQLNSEYSIKSHSHFIDFPSAFSVPSDREFSRRMEDSSQLDVIRLEEMKQMGLQCMARVVGSNVPPIVNITLNGVDITDLFEMSVDRQSGKPEETDGLLESQSCAVLLTYLSLSPPYDWNNRSLVCTASTNWFHPQSATVLLDVSYVPVVYCDIYEYFVSLGSPAVVHCHQCSNPGGYVTWFRYTAPSTYVVLMDDDDIIISEQPEETADCSSILLTFTSVNSSNIGLYVLTVNNRLGSSDVTVSLVRTAGANAPEPRPLIEEFAAAAEKLKQG